MLSVDRLPLVQTFAHRAHGLVRTLELMHLADFVIGFTHSHLALLLAPLLTSTSSATSPALLGAFTIAAMFFPGFAWKRRRRSSKRARRQRTRIVERIHKHPDGSEDRETITTRESDEPG